MAEAIYVNSNEVRGHHLRAIRATTNNEDMIYANVENTKLETKDKVEPQSGCAQKSRTVAVCLGVLCFLLLAGIIGLQVYFHQVKIQHGNLTEDNAQLQTSYANLTEQFNAMKKDLTAEKELLQKEVKDGERRLTDLRDSEIRLTTQNKNLAEDKKLLQASNANLLEQFNTMNKEKDLLQKKVDKGCLKVTDNCPGSGWKAFGCKWYLISAVTGSDMKTWEESRQYCQSKGADLVIINSREEYNFLMMNYINWAWIGLSDRASEGTWKWVDGTTPWGERFWVSGEPNDADGNEDCVHLQIINVASGWNDAPCTQKFNWICEKV